MRVLLVNPCNARNCKPFKLTAKSKKSQKYSGFGEAAAFIRASLAVSEGVII
jgi:hypothetical protein